ncbi:MULTISPECIES: hypothetical protein [Acidithiobacillus]|uniref:Uncharacterized protein n=2 Tax=Acidithiobacillus TaxID=119977 RepID=A0A179BQ10_ACIFR|nr:MULTISPECIES: hypothetical protein [Acidithiobacillus]MEB8475578.1 hypothetical protein [Acidithiobacillus ferriphilus]MEB8487418.1 hypothetical protein [Acidithiobacillus ferriphilus]MEB8491393.1 hypothetical protein [Acidithiobacillus ferriphilus]MEB8493233.1 hypothetical protein [Acidithiobacillus ferriphilus]MEB8514877.1 hypothetical protein [Acidithiobacillus ferriphilus]
MKLSQLIGNNSRSVVYGAVPTGPRDKVVYNGGRGTEIRINKKDLTVTVSLCGVSTIARCAADAFDDEVQHAHRLADSLRASC